MKYQVSARDWDTDFRLRFGDNYSVHELSDTEVVESIKQFGRAEILNRGENSPLWLEFHNTYD